MIGFYDDDMSFTMRWGFMMISQISRWEKVHDNGMSFTMGQRNDDGLSFMMGKGFMMMTCVSRGDMVNDDRSCFTIKKGFHDDGMSFTMG